MTQPGRAAIEIVGDASKLGPQLERDAQRAIDRVDIDTDNISRQIGDGFRDGAAEAIDAFDDISEHFASTSQRIRRESDGMFDNIGSAARDAGDDVRSNFLRPLTSGFSRLGETISSAGSAFVGFALTGTNPAGLLSLALTAAAVTAALPVILGLAAALADLAGIAAVLPAALGGAVASVIVLTVAFNGFGDAIGAVLDGDPEKIAEAMERLAPAARSVVKEFQAVLPIFREVGDAIQQSFFVQLTNVVGRFGSVTLPRLRDELRAVSASLGSTFAGLANLANDVENVSILERLLASTARITDNLGQSFINLGQSFLNAIDAGLPSLETLSSRLAGAIDSFAAFINTSIEDGSFQEFLDDAIATLDELLALGGAVGELLGVLFSGTDDAGRGFIGTLTDITQRMTEFFKSAEGQDAIEDFAEIIGAVGMILGFSANLLRETIDLFTELDDIVNETIAIFDAFGSGLSAAWDTVVAGVSEAVAAVGAFFSALPGQISTFIESIPGRVAAAFQAVADLALNILATMIASVIVFFTDLPGQIIGALGALTSLITGMFTSAEESTVGIFTRIRDFIVTNWDEIVAFFFGLPARVGAAFQQVHDGIVARVAAMIEFVKGLPGRILAAIGNAAVLLYNAGANIIQGLINGISSRIGQLRDKIAAAVQEIRDHLPFSPARTGPLSGSGSPQIAGAVIAEMIAAGLDAGTPLISQAAGRAASATTSPFGAIGQAGVTPLISPTGTAGTTSVMSPVQASTEAQPVFLVRIGNEDIEAFIDKRVDERVQVETRRLISGTRGI